MRVLIALCFATLFATSSVAQDVGVSERTEADGSRTLVHTVTVPAQAEQVWTAITTAEGWRTWAVPLARVTPGTNRFETSYNPAAAVGAPDTIEHEWLERDAPRQASFRTTRTPAGFPHSDAYKAVTSTFILTPAGEATRVELTSRGYSAGAEGEALVGFFREGNRMTLEQLHRRFASGPIDWAARPGQSPTN
jgi:uncharacterized protein YndB with AHSA1/START domain